MSNFTSATFVSATSNLGQADLGYRWEAGMDDWDVLIELCGGERAATVMVQSEGHYASLVDQARTWKQVGFVWDWALDPDNHRLPWGVANELDKL